MPTVPTVPTFAPGVLSTSKLSQLAAATNFLLLPPVAELRQTVAQSLTNNTWTALTMDVEDFDVDVDGVGGHDNVTNPARFTVQYPGRYALSGGYGPASNASGVRGMRFAVNGSVINASQSVIPAAAFVICPSRVKQIYLTFGDYVEPQGFQSSGAGLLTSVTANEQSSFSIKFLGR